VKLTTRGRYGLRAMLELARCFDGPPVLMSTLAARERLSRKYLHALLAALKSAGLVYSVRGAGGGFRLSKPPSDIHLGEILQAVEGPLSLVECVTCADACDRARDCTARRVWQELSGVIEAALEGITLGNLIATETREGARTKSATATKSKKRAGKPGCGCPQDPHHARPTTGGRVR
jgi:Rrf2 family protein